ncbi:MAG: class I SAM-dependent methyltransferase [Armatimonadota bacterium]
MSGYKMPEFIPCDMGGVGDVLDERLDEVIRLLGCAPINDLHSFLDIGFGQGQLTKWLCRMGKSVTATGIAFDSYCCDIEQFRSEYGVLVEECYVDNMPFADKSFDGVIMSHILEHCPNMQLALQEVRRVLLDTGYLFIFVPPHSDRVCAGHISVGWNIGQLMYVLLLNGFDVKHGMFTRLGHNVAACVRKNLQPLPPLRGDRGDIAILNQHDLFPVPVHTSDGYNDSFNGNIRSINWPSAPRASKHTLKQNVKDALIYLVDLMHPEMRNRLCTVMERITLILARASDNDMLR